jgi:isoleucyl-tRNA synthetase
MREVPSHVSSDELERGLLSYWEDNKTFEKSLEQNREKKIFTFYDGPPYATGKPHYGHVLQSALKDTVLRYKTMQGYYVPRRNGWDTHGLPIENIVEKELGITSKKQIEDDIEGFTKKCREVVYRYIDEFRLTLKRMGRWADYGNEYSTLDRSYMDAEWGVFKALWDKDLIYKSFRSTPFCIRCSTPLSNFEVGMAYKDVKDMSVYVALQTNVKTRKLLVWTTTPWTLPGNVAVAYNPDLEYVVVQHEDGEYVIAKDRVKAVLGEEATIVRSLTVQDLSEYTYEPMYESSLSEEECANSFRMVPSDHVTAQDGTGLVHMAPAFGEEDHLVAKNTGLPILRTVDVLGMYMSDVPLWAGRNIFEAQKDIIKDLRTRGVLFKQELIEHSYPFCWRCDTPLIYYAIDSWFVKISQIKDAMLKANEQIHWVPEHVKEGRFGKGIESAPDWAVSRNRFWSVPMPIWECDSCEARVCIGGVEELKKSSGASDDQVQDIHRPYVDRIVWQCSNCTGTMKRIPQVLDVWFDSGSMPYASGQESFPADFIVESIEMTRAWFYVLHVLATALKGGPAFLNPIASGIIFAEDGQKLSKKLKNYPELEPVLKTYGADVLRLYLLSSSTLGEPYLFSEKGIRQVQRNVYMTLWNVYSMFTRYANVHGWKPPHLAEKVQDGVMVISSNRLDQWILARTNQLVREVTKQTDAYRIDTAARLFIDYVDDLSNWYVRRSRGRLQHPQHDTERDEVFGTLYAVLVTVSKLLAPFMPFVSEELYRNLTGEESVHLSEYPVVEIFDEKAISDMQAVRDAVSEGLALRAEAKLKVRQPLARLTIPKGEYTPEDTEMIADEVNVKEVVQGDTFDLDITITEELKAEGIARDVIRFGQVLRKEAGYALDDRITVAVQTDSEEIMKALKTHEALIAEALQADEVVDALENPDKSEEVKIAGAIVTISVKK